MCAKHDPVEELLTAILDGRPEHREHVDDDTDADTRARVESLRDVSRIAEFSRGVQRSAEPGMTPERWGDLLLLERLGLGAQAEVFRAWDPGLRREVALKLLRSGHDDDALMEEGRHIARVRHPHVVTVHGIDRRDDRVGLWMELVRGSTLEHGVVTSGPYDAARATALGLEIGGALDAVHAAGLLHRDVKPANIVRDAAGRHVLADFGLGVRVDPTLPAPPGPSGTPMYMAPEVLAGASPTVRSDVYSLGLVLWFALTGRHPFESGSLEELIEAARRGVRPLRQVRRDVPASLAAAIDRATLPTPEGRLASARELVEALEAVRLGSRRRPQTRVVAIVAAAIVLAVIAVGVRRGHRCGARRHRP
jgi:serine/threonine protein kinase